MSKEIILTQGKVTIVDNEDYDYLMQWKWQFHNGYARRTQHICMIGTKRIKKQIALHRIVLNNPDGLQVDHINGNRLDNRKENLRVCTCAENVRNRSTPSNNTSGFKGVFWDKRMKKWQAQISADSKTIRLGYFTSTIEAAKAYNIAATELHGQFAKINQIPAL